MDPNANLAEQRLIAKRILGCENGVDCRHCKFDGERLAELVEALDEWISRGGFLPDAWRKQ